MPKPTTIKKLDDLILNLIDFRAGPKVQTLDEFELINDAILVILAYRELKKAEVVNE